jgi:HEAT repeat protein/beta-lactamase regulating signal transducer with metallopeptidase domain
MNSIIALDPEFSASFVMTLAHFLWQGAAIGLVVFVIGIVLRRASSRLRYGTFLAALLAMALCPPVTYSLLEPADLESFAASMPSGQPNGLGQPELSTASGPLAQTDPTDPTERPDPSDLPAFAPTNAPGDDRLAAAPSPAETRHVEDALSSAPVATNWQIYAPYLILAYIAGVLLMLARLALGLAGGGRLRNRADRITDHAILNALNRHAKQLKLRAIPVVAYCQRVAVPTVVGVIRPMILLPASLATGMPPQQVELLLLHELAHIRRYDHLINIAQRLIEAALFFHPALWYVSHRIRVEREHCCDDLVIALGGEAHAYAESLVAAAALAMGARLSPAALAATGKPSQLRRRIHRLLCDPQPPVRLVRGGWVLTALVAVALIAGATQVANLNTAEPERENFAQAESTPEPVAPADVTTGPAETRPEPSDVPVVEGRTTGIDPNVADPTPTVPVAAPRESAQTGAQPGDASPDSALIPAEETKEFTDKYSELSSQQKDPDWWLRKVAVQQIGDLPYHPQFVLSLILSLKDEDPRVQAAAAEGLAKQGDPDAIKHLVAALKEESQVREAAAEALTYFKPEDVMPLLTLAARDEDSSVRLGAIVGLGKQNTADAAAVLVDLLPTFYDESPGRVPPRARTVPVNPMTLRPTGAAVAKAFADMDPAIARSALLEASTKSDWRTLMQTALVIGASDLQREPDLQNALIGMLKHERKDVRAAAAQVLSEAVKSRAAAGEAATPEVLAALEPLLRDPNRAITWIAADALRGGGWQPESTEERAWFLVATGQGGEASTLGPVALEPFVHLLNADSSPAFSLQGEETSPPLDIVRYLSELNDPRKVEPLISVLTRFGDETTKQISSVLGVSGDPRALEPLTALLGHLNADVQYSAVWALGRLKDPRAVDPLIGMLDHPNDGIREQAIVALGQIGDSRAADAVRPFLGNEVDGLVFEAAKALGAFKDAQSSPRIAELYREVSPESETSDIYSSALVSIDGPIVEQTFMDILKGNPSEKKRTQAARALSELKSTQAIPFLREAILFDTNDSVKGTAIEALGRIGGEDAALALASLQDKEDERTRNLFFEYVNPIAKALSAIDNETSSDALASLYQDFQTESHVAPAHLTAAMTLAERGDPRGRTMLEELQNIPETRIAATNALQELEQSRPEAETTSPEPTPPSAVQPDESPQPVQPPAPAAPAIPDQPGQPEEPSAPAAPDPTDRSDPSDPAPQTSQLAGPRLQFRWVLEGPTLAAPTESEPYRTLAVADELVLAEGDIASAEVQKDPNSEYFQVLFQTTEDGAKKLKAATEGNLSRKLAIVFDGRVLSAPVVRAPIGSSGAITGNLSEAEAKAIADTITSMRNVEQPSTTASPGVPSESAPPNQTDPTDRSDPSDQSDSDAKRSSRLTGPRLQFRWVVEGDEAEGKTILPAPTEDEPDRTLVVSDDVVFYERDVQSAITKKEPNGDAYAVFFVTTEDGEQRLWNATEQNQGKRLAIIFDGRVLSAPVVQSPIGKSGQITGDLTEEEAEVIAGAINDALDSDEALPKPILYDKEVVFPEGREPILDRDAAEKRGDKIKEIPGDGEPFLYDKLLPREGEVMGQDLLKPVVPEVVERR